MLLSKLISKFCTIQEVVGKKKRSISWYKTDVTRCHKGATEPVKSVTQSRKSSQLFTMHVYEFFSICRANVHTHQIIFVQEHGQTNERRDAPNIVCACANRL